MDPVSPGDLNPWFTAATLLLNKAPLHGEMRLGGNFVQKARSRVRFADPLRRAAQAIVG